MSQPGELDYTDVCDACGGTGWDDDGDEVCFFCNGSGVIWHER